MNILDYFKPFSARPAIYATAPPSLSAAACLPVEQALVTYKLSISELATFIGTELSQNVSIGASLADFVSYTTDQSGSINEAEAAKARNNIGAAPVTGSSGIVNLGVVTSGTWNATAVGVAYGGTGARTAGDARTNLGLGGSATRDVGQDTSTVAAGDDSRFLILGGTSVSHTGALSSGSTGDGNVAIGLSSMSQNGTGSENTAVGSQALQHNVGNLNTATGSSALQYNASGEGNTANGYQSLYLNTTGSRNVAVGDHAAYSNLTGAGNTACGSAALYFSVDGTQNTAAGSYALCASIHGNQNSAHGAQTLASVIYGNLNSALGYGAGNDYGAEGVEQLTYANNSVYIGAQTRAGANYVTNETVLGYDAYGAGSNTATIGNTSNALVVLNGVVRHTVIGNRTNLPTTHTAGQRTFVSNSSQTAAGNFGEALSSSIGSHTVPVYSDGSVWRIG